MTICDKIQNVGDTLETNLNNRGVSCTFGTGSGEKNILEMVNLITSSNLKGSSDAVISISASRPYLLTSEKTDIIVTLKDGLGNPLANKSVTVSDGTSVYSGITNIEGTFTLYDLTIAADTTFTATYSTVSDSCLVELCNFVDYAVTNNKNTNWSNYSNRLSITVDTIGTLVSKGSSNGFYYADNGSTFTDYIAEFDVVSCSAALWYHSGQSSTSQNIINLATYFSSGGHCKIVSDDGVAKVYKDSTQVGSDITVTATSPFAIGFRVNTGSEERSIKYKNFRLHTL